MLRMVKGMKLIMEKLEMINSRLEFIEKHMVDADTILTPEEEKKLNKSLKDYKEGKAISLEELKKRRR